MSTEELEPTVPDAHTPPAPSDPLAITPELPASARETWIDEPDEPPALGAEAHGDLQKQLDGLAAARRPSLFRRLLKAVLGWESDA